jgi:NADH:ubiquinone oxidoreductase subunit E
MAESIKKNLSEVELTNVKEILKSHQEENGNIITLLQSIQEKFSFLPNYILKYLALKLKIPLAKLYGVATFYAQFSFNKKGKYVVTVCDGTACHVKGSPLLIAFLESFLEIKNGETSKDEMFTLETVACLGCCAIAPVIVVNEEVFGNLTMNKTKKIINKFKKEAGVQ